MLYFVTIEVISEEQRDGSILGECEVILDDYLSKVKCSKKIALKILSFFMERGDLAFEVKGARIWLKDHNFWDRVDEYTKRKIVGFRPDRRHKTRGEVGSMIVGNEREGGNG